MNILFLGNEDSPLIDFISLTDDVIFTSSKIDADFVSRNKIDFIVSYGYRHIIKSDVLELLPNKVINLHISYLPWNRGSDPNFWSIVDLTPKGVTIHLVDKGIDTGGILLQEPVGIFDVDTLRTSYAKLQFAIQLLFVNNWYSLKNGLIKSKKQKGGTYHKSTDKDKYIFDVNWLDMTVSELISYVADTQMSGQFKQLLN